MEIGLPHCMRKLCTSEHFNSAYSYAVTKTISLNLGLHLLLKLARFEVLPQEPVWPLNKQGDHVSPYE